MCRKILILASCLLVSCASFDRTNILPGQRVPGPGYSFVVPTEHAWSAVEYGTSNKIHLFQLNDQDNYSIVVALNRGPRSGMYDTAEAHLRAFRLSQYLGLKSSGLHLLHHAEWLEPMYGKVCVAYSYGAEDWQGRAKRGPALKDVFGLACEFPSVSNVLINIELSRRYEPSAEIVDLQTIAHALFSSFKYHH